MDLPPTDFLLGLSVPRFTSYNWKGNHNLHVNRFDVEVVLAKPSIASILS